MKQKHDIGGLRRQTGQLPDPSDHGSEADRPYERHFMRTPAFRGDRPFLCHVCGKRLALHIEGEMFELTLHCHRCKCVITIRMPAELMPNGTVVNAMTLHAGG